MEVGTLVGGDIHSEGRNHSRINGFKELTK